MTIADRMDPRMGNMVYLVHFLWRSPKSVFPNSRRVEEGLVERSQDFIDELKVPDRYYGYPGFVAMVGIDKWLRNKYGSPGEAVRNIDEAILSARTTDNKKWVPHYEEAAVPLFDILSPIYVELMSRGKFDSWDCFEIPLNPK